MKKTKSPGTAAPPSSSSNGKPSKNSIAIKESPVNPRKISQERLALLKRQQAEFGDLSGFVHNVRTGELVCGHQRLKNIGEHEVHIEKSYSAPTAAGTVAEGWIEYAGERFAFRQVDWSEDKARKAMLAANNSAGEWETGSLADLIEQISPDELDLTGFTGQELTNLLGGGGDEEERETGKQLNPAGKCDYPIVPRVLESYKYVVVIADNTLDFVALCELVGVEQQMNEGGYKMPGRIIWFKDFMARLKAKGLK
jgi:hypothetical protein